MLDLRVSIMGRSLMSLQMVLRNQRPFPGKKVLPYPDDMVNDYSPITLSNEGLSGTNKVETTKASSERVDRGTP